MAGPCNTDPLSKIMLLGYDPVAFHTEGEPTRGNPTIASQVDEYTYLFATEENRSRFEAQPEAYLPAYGGYCAYGVSIGVLFPTEIDTWEILDGRLTLQFSQDVKQLFHEDTPGNKEKADTHWPEFEKRNVTP